MLGSDDYEKKAWELFCADRDLEAADLLREAVRSYPYNLDLWEHLLICLGNSHEYGEFLATYREYQALGGKAVSARVWHAIALRNLGKPGAAIAEISSLSDDERLELYDGVQAMLCLTSLAVQRAFRLPVAALGLKIALKLAARHPDEAEPHFAVGFWMSTGRKCTKKALAHIAKGVELAPDRLDFRAYYGNCLYDMRRRQEALAEWEKIPLDKISCEMALGRMAAIYECMGEPDKCAACKARLGELEEKDHREKSLSDDDIRRLIGNAT